MNAPSNRDAITLAEALTLDGLFGARVRRTPEAVAYRDFNQQHANWRDYTWAQIDHQVALWQAAILRDGLKQGDRVGIMLRNSPEWVICDHAVLGLGLVVVPVYFQDRPDNVAYILKDAGCKMLLCGSLEQWRAFMLVRDQLEGLARVVIVEPHGESDDPRTISLADWLPDKAEATHHVPRDPSALATIVYTSGTTGRPKGVMLSHRNILTNTAGSLEIVTVTPADTLLSFLPLSHMFERTCGYYLTIMAGATTAFARSVKELAEDLLTIRPTQLISVPRIYERVYVAIRAKLDAGPPLRKKLFEFAVDVGWKRYVRSQGRGSWHPSFLLWPVLKVLVANKIMERLGGRLKGAFAGGAAMAPEVARVFIGLGLPVIQGYGLTETSPVVCANRMDDNLPASVGLPISDVEVKIGDKNALLIRGPNVMLGYWNNPEATRSLIDSDGWLNSGDTARIDEAGHIFITGRLKEIIVMSNGEKIPPVDIEAAIMNDALFEQVMLIGEGKPYLSAMVVLNRAEWQKLAAAHGKSAGETSAQDAGMKKVLLNRVGAQMQAFPGYAQVRCMYATLEPWTVENGLITPTLKLRRNLIMEKFQSTVDEMYSGH